MGGVRGDPVGTWEPHQRRFMLTAEDIEQLRAHGIRSEEAERQLRLLRDPARYLDLARPCRVGDGVVRLDEAEHAELIDRHAQAAWAGRCLKFTPASGAATRMFQDLRPFHWGTGRKMTWAAVGERTREGDSAARALVAWFEGLHQLALYNELAADLAARGIEIESLRREGAFVPVLDRLFAEDGLDAAQRAKGLLPFHCYDDGPRTAFEEHLVESAGYVRDREGVCRLHFTVSGEHQAAFERLLAERGPLHAARLDARWEVGFSGQQASTDTVAVDSKGRLARDAAGRLVLRPGGHGALIENLDALQGDIVFIKNIDNVQPDARRETTLRWKRILGGLAVRLQQEIVGHIEALRQREVDEALVDAALAFARRALHIEPGPREGPPTLQSKRAFVLRRLNRPLRVCGVVPNTGEPGGGPFWVRERDGTLTLQLVESVQVHPDQGAQQRILRESTHFNPVDLVCALRDSSGRPFDLGTFVDPNAAIVTRKVAPGGELHVLERPGLWNGAMAGWNTVFVEVPLDTFTPVKTLQDLLRPEHI
jgi:hypothetical protein